MKNTHAAVESAKSICLDKHSVDFDQAVNYMSGQVARIFPKSYESSAKRKRQISGVDTKSRGRGRGSAVAVAAVVAGAAMEAVEAAEEAAVDAVDLVVVLP